MCCDGAPVGVLCFKVRLRWFGADLLKLQYLSFIKGIERAI